MKGSPIRGDAIVPTPGIYGLARGDGELRLWANRARDGSLTSWPIWFARANKIGNLSILYGIPEVSDAEQSWHPVYFGKADLSIESALGSTSTEASRAPAQDFKAFKALRLRIDEKIWWTSPRKSPRRRALYMPSMPRTDLIALVTDLEACADRGIKQVSHLPIGIWIRRAWNALEERERAEAGTS